jgi:hypothetical protein
MDGVARQPSRRERLLFWLLVSCISFFFAEIVSGSSMIRDLSPGGILFQVAWSVLITIPLYGLHTLVLAWIIYRFSKPRLYTLFLAGAIFGLYEAYMTKVLWLGWGSETIWYLGGVAVVETAVLILFWHPFMAFIVPLFVSESMLTRSREVLSGLPRPLQKLFTTPRRAHAAILLFGLLCGVNQGGLSPSPLHAIFTGATTGLIFVSLVFLYRRLGLQRYDIRQLLPTKKEFAVLLGLLLLMYLALGLIIKPEALLNLLPQCIVWLLYAFFFALFYLSLGKSARAGQAVADFPIRFSWRWFLAFLVILTATSALVSLVPFRMLVTMLFLAIGVLIGAAMLALSVLDACRRPRAT